MAICYELGLTKISSDLKSIVSHDKKVRVIVRPNESLTLNEMISLLRDANIEVLENESFVGLVPEVVCLVGRIELQTLDEMEQVTSIEHDDGKMSIQS